MTARRPGKACLGKAAPHIAWAMAFVFFVLPALFAAMWHNSESGYTPLQLESPPVYARIDAGERMYLLTSHRTYFRPAMQPKSKLFRSNPRVELWAIDPANAATIWRKRLEEEKPPTIASGALLGVHGDTVWLLSSGELIALGAESGTLKATRVDFESINPQLAGMIPDETRYFTFDKNGLQITATDARNWRLDPDTFKAHLDVAESTTPAAAFPPVFYSTVITWSHLVRGIDTPGEWMGLLTPEEAVTFEKNNALGGLTSDTRRGLWAGRSHPPGDSFGALPDYFDLNPVPGAPDFLDGGLLRERGTLEGLPPIHLADPDSVLVLHRERLGETAALRLARVTRPDGRTVWETALPLTRVYSVVRAETAVLLFGIEYRQDDPGVRDPARDSPQRLVAVEFASGAAHVHSHTGFDSYPEAEPVNLRR